MNILDSLQKLALESGFASFFTADGGWKNLVMILIAFVLLYLGIVKKYEPLLLCGIAFGCLLSNLSYFVGQGDNALYHPELWAQFIDETSPYYHSYGHIMSNAGLLDFFYIGVKAGIYPSLIFLGVGAMTDFGPLLANPKSLLLGAAAQLGVFLAFFLAVCIGFSGPEAASIGIIGDIHRHPPCPAAIGSHRNCGVLIHGAHPNDTAAAHEASDDRANVQGQDGAGS